VSALLNLPAYLSKYVVEQDYAAYTPVEQATWRFIMRQSRAFFADHAVDIYLEGLKRTGIPIDRIPKITEMDQRLRDFGWGAVGVEGFVPSSVFLDLLARRILPIATDMRTLDHIGYTPAPDIVHEAAGHAPIIADADYRNFLSRYSELAYRAIISAEDIALYEAIRYLSDIKENPDIKADEIARATAKLKAVYRSMEHVSEATKVARLGWWTIEYGLVAKRDKLKIYGAGLLSSIDESRNCLSTSVRKVPLSAECVYQGYDITEPQPQLFVAEHLQALPALLSEIESYFAFRLGGEYGLREILRAETINSIVLDSGVSVSGVLVDYNFDGKAQIEYLKLSGPSQLCYQEAELPGQGREHHPHGFSTPLGRWKMMPERDPSRLEPHDLARVALVEGNRSTLELQNGFSVSGILQAVHRRDAKLIALSWTDCTVKRGDKVYFEPSWGSFDQLVGSSVSSVFAGPADRAAYGDYEVGAASTSPGRSSPISSGEREIHAIYQSLRQLRADPSLSSVSFAAKLEHLAPQILKHHTWLAALEVLEVASQRFQMKWPDVESLKTIKTEVLDRFTDNDRRSQIDRGMQLMTVVD
jgi:phenylalanine-4-hydroxylase